MLGKETVADLLEIVEADVGVPTLQVLEAIVQYGLEPDARAELGPRVVEHLDVPAGTWQRAEYLRAMAQVPVDRATQRLREIAEDIDDPDSFTAAKLLGASQEHDPVARHVPLLVRLAEQGGDLDALRELASLPLERYGVEAAVFAPSLAAEDIDTRLWAAIAVAKLGDHAQLMRVLSELADRPPMWMWGNPWTPYEILSKARPVPEETRTALLALDEDDLVRDQRILVWALTGAKSATGMGLETQPGDPPDARPEAPSTVSDADGFLAAVREATSQGDYRRLPHDEVRRADSLPPAQHADVVTWLVETTLSRHDPGASIGWGNATMDALGQARSIRLDLDRIVDSFVQAESPGMNVGQLGAVLARADDDRVVRSVVQALRHAPAARTDDLVNLLEQSSRGHVVYLGAGGSGSSPPPPPPRPPQAAPTAPVPPPAAPSAPFPSRRLPEPTMAPRRSRGLRWPRIRLPHRSRPIQMSGDSLQLGGEDLALVRYTAYPRIAVDDDVVVIGEEFIVTIGLADMPAPDVASPGPIAFAVESFPIEDLEVELVVDPESLEVVDSQRVFPLRVKAIDDFPVQRVRLRALFTPGLEQDRRIALLYRRSGRVVGFAFRMVRAVENEAARRRSSRPAPIRETVLDLAPLVDDGPPDLLLCLFRGDAPDSYVWGVYPRSRAAVPDLRRGGVLPGARDFATYTQRAVRARDFKGSKSYDQLVGYGTLIDDAMPKVVTEAVRAALAGAPDRAPSVLLLTQEPFVPWELAVPTPRFHTTYGGDSPFLGAHASISRWPLSENQKPELTRVPTLTVSRQAAITADYTGVKAWPPLEHARAEARELVTSYGMTEVRASRDELRACLTGDTAYDVIHVALHGQKDPQGLEDGLVLLEPDTSGNPAPTFFNATQVLGLENQASRPFVFLNACQVGSGDAILGTYAGFATNLLRTRASAVVAPLWNVDDDVAAGITRDFYAAAYAADPVPVAEILRRVRASYTKTGVDADPDACTPTLIAYQCFGHPHFTLRRQPNEEP